MILGQVFGDVHFLALLELEHELLLEDSFLFQYRFDEEYVVEAANTNDKSKFY